MSNTLTGLYTPIFKALTIVNREAVGYLQAVSRDSSGDRIAKGGESLTVPIAGASTTFDITPSMTPPAGNDQVVTNATVSMDKSKAASFNWNGEETLGMSVSDNYDDITTQSIAQAIRTLINEMESDIGTSLLNASRAVGIAGTTPFASDHDLLIDAGQILTDNGAPLTDRNIVMNTSAGSNLRKLANLNRVDQSGDTNLLRRGILGNLDGFDLRESAGVGSNTAGTGTGYLVDNGAGYVVGDVAITVDTGTGTVLAGNTITFANHTDQYVVETALAGGVITIAAPGLREAVPDDNAITLGALYTGNLAFHRNAIQLVTRAPALPVNGDVASARMTVVDPVTGISFEFIEYKGYNMNSYQVAAAWGNAVIDSNKIATIKG